MASDASLQLDTINRSAWKLPSAVRIYARLKGWTDPGEKAAVEHVAAEARARPILDIGVGGGRTTDILQLISKDYVGIDYTQELVEACRARHPGKRIMHMDARDLRAFADGQFALAVFSFNGIDAVNRADRRKILQEVHRVLKPGGLFFFSAHNRHGPGCGERPRVRVEFSWNPFKLGWRILRLLRSLPASIANHRRLRAMNEVHDEWAVANCGAHDFGIVVMYTSMAEQKRQLESAGFGTELVLDCVNGRPVPDDADTSAIWWFHYIARKV